ncbi:hypothetical protein LP52_03245 [Streptomonospora alba]|uniref:Asparagine synthetase domain-containing protein n=1 Tax=Streptomonospora alba TaxID=183763 RepID=A0A0C2JT35_9ACTN|nr:asparagine synthase-related protein [Streptomonospora alba]KIH99987.1 hypothetical protein LP52_03245 [Streptomonospora alba]
MRFYLALSSAAPDEAAPVPEHVVAAARTLAHRVLPVPADTLRHESWIAPRRNVALLAWTNEPELDRLPDPLVPAHGDGGEGVLGYSGYLVDPADVKPILELGGADPGPLVDRTGGAFGVFRATPAGVDAVTTITRNDPVYFTERARLHVVGNRAALVHLVARAAEEGPDAPMPPAPEYDIPPMQALVRHGFYLTDHTPFRGTTTLTECSTLRIRDGVARTLNRALPEPQPAPNGSEARRKRVKALAEALMESVEPVRQHGEAVSLSLTGGRDSRLVAAMLHAAGIPFRATTRGFEDHPDVILARRICEQLGVSDHRVSAPERDGDEAVLVEHPLPRTTRLLRMTEGMNSAFENVISPTGFLFEARLSGSGGEALRGGWLNDQQSLDRDSLLKKFDTITRAQTPLMTPQAKAEGDRLYAAYTEEFSDPAVGLDRMFLRFRSGRWLPGSRTATLIGYCMYHPFLDHRVRWEAMSLSPRWRWSEDVVFQLLKHLAPKLARLPVADRAWRFDQRRILNPLERRARGRRHALKARTAAGGFDWRRKLGPDYVAPMRERILDTPELFDLVDKDRIEALLNQDPVSRPQQVWHLYSMAVLLSDEWLAPTPPPGEHRERIRVPIR